MPDIDTRWYIPYSAALKKRALVRINSTIHLTETLATSRRYKNMKKGGYPRIDKAMGEAVCERDINIQSLEEDENGQRP